MSLSRKLRFVLSFGANGRGKGGTLHEETGGQPDQRAEQLTGEAEVEARSHDTYIVMAQT
jgi:hypothetical protein